MKIIFSIFLLCLSLFFTIYGSKYTYMSDSGQVGAGFFPFWIGLLLILFTSLTIIKDVKLYMKEKRPIKVTRDTVTLLIIIGLSILFILLLKVLGAVLAMVLYMLSVLFVLNRGKLVFNTVISLIVPLATYFLLDVWLNAGFPKGFLGF